MTSSDQLRYAIGLARAGKREEARDILLRVVDEDPHSELAWMWLAGLVDSLEDKIVACENVLTINPSNEKARSYLERLRQGNRSTNVTGRMVQVRTPRNDPLEQARFLEQEGNLDEALMIYKVEAAKAKDTRTFNEIFRQIVRIEQIQADGIRYVSPRASILRLTFPWILLYLSLALIQVGLDPLGHPTSYVWFAFPWVALGGYLVAVAEVRSRHAIWKYLFTESGDGTLSARFMVGLVGWLMILIPILLLLIDSFRRLSDFQTPPRLF